MTLAVAASIVELPTAHAHAASLAAEDRAGFHDASDRSEVMGGNSNFNRLMRLKAGRAFITSMDFGAAEKLWARGKLPTVTVMMMSSSVPRSGS
jgi:hypothetical protein